MSNTKTSLLFLSIVLVMALAMISVGGPFRPSSQSQEPQLIMHNKTRAFEVTSSVRVGESIYLSLRNGYSQPINAFVLSSAPGSGVQVELTQNDNIISPGATYQYRLRADSLKASAPPDNNLNLTILSVVFEDGTGDGDPQTIADIRDRRTGERVALSQIIPLLESALSSGNALTPENIETLRNQVSVLSDALAKKHQGEVYGGILMSKGQVLGAIKEIEERKAQGQNVQLSTELLHIKESYSRKAARLQRILR